MQWRRITLQAGNMERSIYSRAAIQRLSRTDTKQESETCGEHIRLAVVLIGLLVWFYVTLTA